MKIVLINKTTSEFLKQTGCYTPSSMEAVDFMIPELANDFCEKHRLKNHEVLEVAWDDCNWYEA